ncbi:MAG: winged helix-turn-helix transcriptional regulator [Gemmatimonadetes bacterium]|nr:winged helix-turn-helix transcriptional regulator [Gemmatimonadota bacterium]
MTTAQLPDLVQVYKALGHPARIRILAMLRTGELCACQITAVLALAPSTVSAHLAELRRAGLIAQRKEGRWVHCRVAEREDAGEIGAWLWQRIKRDPQIRRDAGAVKQLRAVPVDELCRVDLDLTRLAIARGTRTPRGDDAMMSERAR